MITTGIIREIGVNKGSFIGNAYKVELNIFQIPGDNDKKNYTYLANCSTIGGLYDSYVVGDMVYVGFVNNNKSLPIIIGKIYQGLQDESRSFANLDALKVKNKAELPETTTIGNIDFSDKEYFFDNVNEVIKDKNLFADSLQLKTNVENAGLIKFNDKEGTAQISLSPDVTMAVGIDAVLKVYNTESTTLFDGQIVYATTSATETSPVALAIGSNYAQAERVMGVVTEPIAAGNYGFVTRRGFVSNIIVDPAIYNVNNALYLSSSVAGEFTNERPVPPNFVTKIGYVSKVSSNSITADGQIYVDIVSIPVAGDIIYDNAYIAEPDFQLDAKNVQGAIDELQLKKADVDLLSSNIVLYRTDAISNPAIINPESPGDNYLRLVTSMADPDYPNLAIEFPQASPINGVVINSLNQYVSGSISVENLFVGDPGQLDVHSIGRIKKTAGNNNQNANFYFKMFKRDINGTETLIATSASTPNITLLDTWISFDVVAALSGVNFSPTDRIVIKSYANYVGLPGGRFVYELGGSESPFRIVLPVPVRIIPTPLASGVIVNTETFNTGILSHLDTNVQHALETINTHTHTHEIPKLQGTLTGKVLELTVVQNNQE